MFELSIDGRIANIVIARGEKRNAVPISGWGELDRLLRAANASDARVIVIRSADAHDFCAGSDLTELRELASDKFKRKTFRGAMESAFKRLRTANKPTVALVNGGCFGTGVSLAAACDLRVAHPDASFAITSARFGMSYPQSDLQRLVDLVGPGQAARLVYTCEHISGTRAEQIGLVEVLDAEEDLGARLIDAITSNAPNSIGSLKCALLGRAGLSERFDESFDSSEFAHGIEAFKSKRLPSY